MKTILDSITGEVLFSTVTEIELQTNQIAINEIFTESYIKPYFNFETRSFYEGATNKELAESIDKENKEKNLACYNELLETDWYFIRKAETGIEVPNEILQQRAQIRARYE